MSRSIISIKTYELGMEDGFMVVSNLRQYKNIDKPHCCTKVMLVPYIFDTSGEKHIIRDGDVISTINGEKTISPKVSNKFKKYA
jgi:hypothetical protein